MKKLFLILFSLFAVLAFATDINNERPDPPDQIACIVDCDCFGIAYPSDTARQSDLDLGMTPYLFVSKSSCNGETKKTDYLDAKFDRDYLKMDGTEVLCHLSDGNNFKLRLSLHNNNREFITNGKHPAYRIRDHG